MGAPSKRAKVVRSAAEFDVSRLTSALGRPRDGGTTIYSWSLRAIYDARNAQMRGDFYLAARLAESIRTDDALFVARSNRCAPQRCVKRELKAAKGARAKAIGSEADALFGQNGVGTHPDTLADIEGCLVDHGVAFSTVTATPRDDGSRIDFQLNYWPIEYVRWDNVRRTFMARVDPTTVQPGDLAASDPAFMTSGFEVPIVHGDGRWVVFQKSEIDPFKHGTLLPAAVVWARHAFAARDWARSSLAHGNAKVVGELPAGVSLQGKDGKPSPEAASFAELLSSIASSETPVGIRPAGSKTDFLTNTSTAWQVFAELINNAEKAAARIYLGTDGTLGTQGGAPGVDITALFGVASTIVQGDLESIERGINTGLIEPWCAVNFGDSSLAPRVRYLLPDNDADAARAALAQRTTEFYAEIAAARENGFDVTQDFVNATAKKYGVAPPTLKVSPTSTVTNPPSAAA